MIAGSELVDTDAKVLLLLDHELHDRREMSYMHAQILSRLSRFLRRLQGNPLRADATGTNCDLCTHDPNGREKNEEREREKAELDPARPGWILHGVKERRQGFDKQCYKQSNRNRTKSTCELKSSLFHGLPAYATPDFPSAGTSPYASSSVVALREGSRTCAARLEGAFSAELGARAGDVGAARMNDCSSTVPRAAGPTPTSSSYTPGQPPPRMRHP